MTAKGAPVAVITGAARGIGAAIARRLSVSGYALGLCDTDREGVESLAKELGNAGSVIPVALDVRHGTAVSAAFARFAAELGGIDVLINGAGVAYFGGVAQSTEDEWIRTLDINVGGYFRAAQAAIPFLRASSRAHVINLSSVWALDGSPTMAAYSTSKHAVEGLTKCLRKEIGKASAGQSAVKVSSIILDKVDTDFREHMTAHVNFDAAARARMLAAADVADAVAFILSTSGRCLPSAITLETFA